MPPGQPLQTRRDIYGPPKTVNLKCSGTGNPAGAATGGVHLCYGSWPSLIMYDKLCLELSYRALWHLKLE